MSDYAIQSPDVSLLPEIQVPAWAWAVVALAVSVMYFVVMENGVALGSAAGAVHDFFHDGRHFSGIPCH